MICVREDLEEVERILDASSVSESPFVEEVCRHIHDSGGKRLRPALIALTCRAIGGGIDEIGVYGAAAEMVHAATLLHDDVLDRATNRRGRTTVSARWGKSAASEPQPSVMLSPKKTTAP